MKISIAPKQQIDILEDILLSGKYNYVHDEFAGELLSELWVTNGTGSCAASSFPSTGVWNVQTNDSPAANDSFALYGKQEFIWDKIGTIWTSRALVGSISNVRACLGVNDPHGDVNYDWYHVGTSLAAGIFFEYNSTISPNWLARVIDATIDWTFDTGLPVVAGTMYDFRIEKITNSNYEFSINKVPVANYTTAITTTINTSNVFYVKTLNTSKKWLGVDSINYLRPKY